MLEALSVYHNLMTAVSTLVIAMSSLVTMVLAVIVHRSSTANQRRTQDLFQAIVLATFLSERWNIGDMSDAIKRFKQHYTGSTQIFK